MNAVLSANTLPWRQSAAFDAALSVGDVDPNDVYDVASRSTFDESFRESLLADSRAVLAKLGLPSNGQIWAPDLIDAKLRLQPQEMDALQSLSAKVGPRGFEGVRATERGALREGAGLPAVAALVVYVVVAVAVYVVVLFQHDQ